ncbi:hypothetical protein M2272_005528 [Mycobacterium frederiksbergense]|uniref:Uncharacterized protein n=1 Tax=Mycolicibacterium frederiksbergense TaxID=117567 RepID=A0ABT6L7H8_9MYCO|nr:hypothetical protein [Mycolicibacterium frederiksbergense]MDH6198864.1 hypothetical protein [Mycolicibacterium frederiksbergense]
MTNHDTIAATQRSVQHRAGDRQLPETSMHELRLTFATRTGRQRRPGNTKLLTNHHDSLITCVNLVTSDRPTRLQL